MSIRDLLQPWKLTTLAIGLELLIAGSFYYQFQDWGIGISLIMGVMAYLFAPWSVRTLLNRDWRKLPLILFLYWLTVDGVYVGYNEFFGHWYVREANFWCSTTLYWLCGVAWMPLGRVRDIWARLQNSRTANLKRTRDFMDTSAATDKSGSSGFRVGHGSHI